MSRQARSRPELTDDSRLARVRERFLTAEPIEPGQVRDTILASWRRCREWHVAADRIDLSYARDPDLDTPLTRNALPVLQSLRDSVQGEAVSVILTDAHGVALSRLTADHDLERHLDSIQLAPGFSYAEELAGTNGIGTALESGQAAHVFGYEHYAEQLEDLACAAVPIRHPSSSKIIGAVNLTCWRKDAGQLLIALTQSTAGQVAQGPLNDSSAEEFELLREYLRACRHTGGLVFALASDMVLMNDQARDTLNPGDQAALLGRAAQALTGDRPGPIDVELPTGARARMRCRPLRGKGRRRLAGGVVHVKLLEPASQATADAGAGWQARRFGPALVGSGPLWLRGCRQVEAACASREWLSLAGEPGTGKLALLRAVCRRRHPAGAFHVLDAADAGDHDWMVRALRGLLEGQGSLVIRHVDQLSTLRLHALRITLEQALAAGRQHVLWVAVTLGQGSVSGDLARLLTFYPGAVELPPLRHHIEDLHELVPLFLARLNPHGPPVCSPEAMHLLLRSNWPGNNEQLGHVLRRVTQHRRTGTIHPADLPPECWSVSRRLLSPLESIERDAIVQSLLDRGRPGLRVERSPLSLARGSGRPDRLTRGRCNVQRHDSCRRSATCPPGRGSQSLPFCVTGGIPGVHQFRRAALSIMQPACCSKRGLSHKAASPAFCDSPAGRPSGGLGCFSQKGGWPGMPAGRSRAMAAIKEGGMPIPRIVGQWNKAGLNRVTRHIAPWTPGFGVVVHRGRRSGREYHTPVNVFATEDGYVLALTYGPDTDWVKNVLAAGGCELRTRGRVIRLVSPRLFHDEARRAIRPLERQVLRVLGAADFLSLKTAPAAAPATGQP